MLLILMALVVVPSVLVADASGAGRTTSRAVALHRDAVQRQDELVPDQDELDDRQLAELDRLRSGLRDLTVLADITPLDTESLTLVLRELHPDADPHADDRRPSSVSASDASTSAMVRDLAAQAGSAERYLLATLPAHI